MARAPGTILSSAPATRQTSVAVTGPTDAGPPAVAGQADAGPADAGPADAGSSGVRGSEAITLFSAMAVSSARHMPSPPAAARKGQSVRPNV